jgi:glyoxylase-like metal-dependent hydrolase (beta-lactamase superfamily II)
MGEHAWRPPVADEWFTVSVAGDGVSRIVEPHVNRALENNVWHVRGRDADLLIDTAHGLGSLRPVIDELAEGRPVVAVVTHAHFDHVGSLHEFEDRRGHAADAAEIRSPFPMRVYRDAFPQGAEEIFTYYGFPVPREIVGAWPSEDFDGDAWVTRGAELTATVEDGNVIDLGDRRLEVLHVPGHTPGSIALWEAESGLLFSGDTVYVESRISFDDPQAGAASLRRLGALPVRRVHAGHERSFDADELRAVIDAELARGPEQA